MQALVHFAVGVFAALLVLVFVDRPAKEEFLTVFVSGFWGLIPDGHWLLREFGLDAPAEAWRAFHQTPYADVFWFHHLVDSFETGRENLEAGIALSILIGLVLAYYRYNDWAVE